MARYDDDDDDDDDNDDDDDDDTIILMIFYRYSWKVLTQLRLYSLKVLRCRASNPLVAKVGFNL